MSGRESMTPVGAPGDRVVHGVNVDREWRLFGECVPANSLRARLGRTAYFYRREAIRWAQWYRRGGIILAADKCRDLALSYLAHYRAAKGVA